MKRGSPLRATGSLRCACLIALTAIGAANLSAEPDRRARRGFRLFARPVGALTINRVYCGIQALGNICTDSTGFGGGGGFWPQGTINQYIFNSGLQLAGIIGSDGGDWAGDTTGAFFFDAAGGVGGGIVSASEVRPLHNLADLGDRADWPAAARVPCNQLVTANCRDPALGGAVQDAAADIYSPVLQGRPGASQGDVWFLTWDGDPSRGNVARPHPLGVLVETRGLGWNYPKGNDDILYFVTTFYNVTARNNAACGGCYDGVRPAMRDILLEQAEQFHALNNAAFGITLPEGGYTIDPLFAAYSADMDVANAGQNYSSVNLPFALGDSYNSRFIEPDGWTFDPGIFGEPFFKGTGFVGVKYLRSPTGKGEIHLFATPTNAGQGLGFSDPLDTWQLYRYLSGNLDPLEGDDTCNTGDPLQTHVCYIWNGGDADIRFFQSSTPLTLAPGGFGTIVVAYIFAPPVDGVCTPPCNISPGDVLAIADPTRAGDPAQVPPQQKLAGYIGWSDINADGVVDQEEFDVVPGSLLGKALTAQAVFDAKFLLPFSPDSPDFFLIPGDNQVTVMWRPSPSEIEGDPYFQIASQAQVGGVINTLYDPNFRQFDVEGYRIYRGRVTTPSDLTMIAQFDYAGTTIRDFGGQVNPTGLCAPELDLVLDCPAPYILSEFELGVQRTVSASIELNQSGSGLTQVRFGERVLLADGSALILEADTTVVGSSGSCTPNLCPPLQDNGVPFVYVDGAVRNNFRYFYAVTAFDVNSWQSGPSSLESARITKAVVPTKPATNYNLETALATSIVGRGVTLDHTAPLPTLDATTGRFSGPMPPADGWDIKFGDFVGQMLSESGAFSARLDSVQQGNPVDDGRPNVFYFTGLAAGAPPVVFTLTAGQALSGTGQTWESLTFPAVPIDDELASRFGGDDSYSLQGQVSITQPGVYQTNGTWRGAAFGNSSAGADLAGQWFDGPRWFDGDPRAGAGETFDYPTQGNCPNNCNWTNATNAGSLTGVTNVHHPMHYMSQNFHWRGVAWANSGAARAADVSVFWGAGGTVDSVIDVTHNVEVPFRTDAQGSWGFLTFAAQSAETGSNDTDPTILTKGDVACVSPLTIAIVAFSANPGCLGTSTPIELVNTAEIGVMGMGVNGSSWEDPANYSTVVTTGFMMYIVGNWFAFDMPALPAAGSIWTMRDYMGAIFGGEGRDGGGNTVDAIGPYSFEPQVRPMTAVGVELVVSYDVINQVNRVTADDISNVHILHHQ